MNPDGEDWTTAPGDNANDGLTPATPKASIQAVLNAYHLQPGDIILVDDGTYNLDTNIVLAAVDSGIIIKGYTNASDPARVATLDRGNTTYGSYVFDFEGANNVTIENVSITGAYDGVYASPSNDSEFITISGSAIYGNADAGINLTSTDGISGYFNINGHASITGNDIYDEPTGIDILGDYDAITDNVIHDDTQYGIDLYDGNCCISSMGMEITGNTIRDIGNTGIAVSDTGDGSANYAVVISGNTVSGTPTGISMNNSELATGNTVSGATRASSATTALRSKTMSCLQTWLASRQVQALSRATEPTMTERASWSGAMGLGSWATLFTATALRSWSPTSMCTATTWLSAQPWRTTWSMPTPMKGSWCRLA